jgi:hypothetical protein
LSDKNETWEKMCVEIQQRSLDNISLEIKSAKILRAEILKVLTAASNEKLLECKIHEIQSLLKLRESSVVNKKGYSEVMGGEKNFRRDKNIAHFKLDNGCWFDFAITINETTKPAQIIGFDFELRFPENLSTPFLRIDLNLPNHNNELQNMQYAFSSSSW